MSSRQTLGGATARVVAGIFEIGIVDMSTSRCASPARSPRIWMRHWTLAAVAGWLACMPGGGPAWSGPIVDQAAPPLTVTQLDGQIFDLSKMRGKVVLVNYWATWCGPCKKEMPLLNAFYQRHHGDGLEMIAISTDRPQDFEKMRKMSRSIAYPTAAVNQISNDGFGPPEGFPLTYVIDANGIVRDKFIDVRDQLLTDIVLPLLQH